MKSRSKDKSVINLINVHKILAMRKSWVTMSKDPSRGDTASALTEYGWIVPVASNVFRKVELKNDVLIPGLKILSLSGDANVRVWMTENPATNDAPLLVTGQTVTNGIDGIHFGEHTNHMLYVETLDSGTATLNYRYEGYGSADRFSCSVDLDICAVEVSFEKSEYFMMHGAEEMQFGIDVECSHDPNGYSLRVDGMSLSSDYNGEAVQLSTLAVGSYPVRLCSNSIPDHYDESTLHVVSVKLEPVTAEANAQGLIFNPCGVAVNGLATYRVEVQPAAVQDEDIKWSVASGGVTFYPASDTGREAVIVIRGGSSESNFKLEVQIGDLSETCRPYIYGRVLEPKTVPIRAYVICDSNGVEAVSAATINEWITEANRIYKQVAMTFCLVSVQNMYGKDKWFDIANSDEFYDMTSYANNTGGLELYCVNSINNAAGRHSDMQLAAGDSRRGMAVMSSASLQTLAHELGHACGLDHVNYTLSGLVSQELLLEANWSGGNGTGHYPPDLEHQNLVRRILMYPYKVNSAQDIPFGSVRGSFNEGGTVIVSPKPCGLTNMVTREPTH